MTDRPKVPRAPVDQEVTLSGQPFWDKLARESIPQPAYDIAPHYQPGPIGLTSAERELATLKQHYNKVDRDRSEAWGRAHAAESKLTDTERERDAAIGFRAKLATLLGFRFDCDDGVPFDRIISILNESARAHDRAESAERDLAAAREELRTVTVERDESIRDESIAALQRTDAERRLAELTTAATYATWSNDPERHAQRCAELARVLHRQASEAGAKEESVGETTAVPLTAAQVARDVWTLRDRGDDSGAVALVERYAREQAPSLCGTPTTTDWCIACRRGWEVTATKDQEQRAKIHELKTQLAAATAERDRLKAELDRERMRLAACGVAAHGGSVDCRPEYRSDTLETILALWRRVHLTERERDAARAQPAGDALREAGVRQILLRALVLITKGTRDCERCRGQWCDACGPDALALEAFARELRRDWLPQPCPHPSMGVGETGVCPACCETVTILARAALAAAPVARDGGGEALPTLAELHERVGKPDSPYLHSVHMERRVGLIEQWIAARESSGAR